LERWSGSFLRGVFWLSIARRLTLGYQFSPRLADLGAARLWRIDQTTVRDSCEKCQYSHSCNNADENRSE